jgi:hypothetical protein
MVNPRATSLKGVSAGQLPNQVKRRNTVTKLQNTTRLIGEVLNPLLIKLELLKEKANNNKTAKSKATTPPNLLGIERRIA